MRPAGRTRSSILVALVALVASTLSMSPAGAQPTTCTFSFPLSISPGLSMTPGSGTLTTGGPTGTITCDGPVSGRIPTGSGPLSVVGDYGTTSAEGDTCLGGGGTAGYSFTLPTNKGPVTVRGSGAYRFGTVPIVAPAGEVGNAQYEDEQARVTMQFVPKEGTCYATPLTRVEVQGAYEFK